MICIFHPNPRSPMLVSDKRNRQMLDYGRLRWVQGFFLGSVLGVIVAVLSILVLFPSALPLH